ncbi:MAG: sulfatase-like hydrolase/transferase [Thermogutta sp.]|nr:sulfatase-like hydrolase/transferase [Thermogutta sp.]
MMKIRIAVLFLAILPFCGAAVASESVDEAAARPNILWLTCEDTGPHLGCYGDAYSHTPNLDALAQRGTIYLHAWSTAPVCAPARTAIITGMYPSSTGAEHMRSWVPFPQRFSFYPQILRGAGYYCTNNSKEDYNLINNGRVWDESSGKAHWKNRPAGKPFFAIFNFTITHESRIRDRPHDLIHDPNKVRLPAYHPDTPEVRRDWAQYYDRITQMDAMAGEKLREVEEAGLADETIVFFYGDHGSGMPRSKRCLYNSGLQVPLIVYIPPKFRHLAAPDYQPGGKTERLAAFVDLAPTVLSLAGIRPPDWMEGHAFLGPYAAEPQPFLFGLRGRMDERYDLLRSVTDGRYVYIRNYIPYLPLGQHVAYMFQTPTTKIWKELYDAGRLTEQQAYFWQRPRAPEELYDLRSDPDEVNNLAGRPEYREVQARLEKALRDHILATRDLGFLPESELHSRAGTGTPYDYGRGRTYPLPRILQAAEKASSLNPADLPDLISFLDDDDAAVRSWAALGLLTQGEDAVKSAREKLAARLSDDSPAVRIAAAWALGRFGNDEQREQALQTLAPLIPYENNGPYVAMMALTVVDDLGPLAADLRDIVEKNGHPEVAPIHNRFKDGIPRLAEHFLQLVSP